MRIQIVMSLVGAIIIYLWDFYINSFYIWYRI